jgi:hypothetical protein
MTDTLVVAYYCRGFGQVFLANDTLIHSISVWRPARPESDAYARRLFITEADSLGRPITLNVLLAGPSIVNKVGDGVHPVEYRFVFDPPFALPRPGKYFFDILADEFSAFYILATAKNSYPDGQAFLTGPTADCSRPATPHDRGPLLDLVFTVEFCHESKPLSVGNGEVGRIIINGPNPTSGYFSITTPAMPGVEARLLIFDLSGRSVTVVRAPSGGQLEWDSRDRSGKLVPGGIYVYRLELGKYRQDGKVVVLR